MQRFSSPGRDLINQIQPLRVYQSRRESFIDFGSLGTQAAPKSGVSGEALERFAQCSDILRGDKQAIPVILD